MLDTILSIVLAVLGLFFAGLSYYLEIKRKIVEQANKEISNAQDVTTDNKERMAFVVAQLKALVPVALRIILTEKRLEVIAQAAFDKIKEYAKKHAEEKAREQAQ